MTLPHPVLVVLREAIDDDGNREGEDEDAKESTEATNELTHSRVGRPVPVAHRGEDHQPPPEALREAPASCGLFLSKIDKTEKFQNVGHFERFDELINLENVRTQTKSRTINSPSSLLAWPNVDKRD